MKILRYIFGLLVVLGLLFADAAMGPTLFARWFYLFMAAGLFSLLRLLFAGTNPDRALAFTAANTALTGFCVILAISAREPVYMDIAIAWALQSYLVTLLLGKYFEGAGIYD